ncbi:metallophosphoesterase family protein [Neobacillus thermocopriae]|uniref:DNA repair exonuclease n=1 Tax=Neobacillus thermocopriae TaxID=1215031 RepID=A0A6B3TSK2_9BACI|nr:DNA repair exonuclease [Neobacillus thermocopriae]MED3623031.1 DNA repair exonuclease [Neobacillus thermocopriae]MED3714926.1 DNA repair exonuclease [Neobacillus thermocopriae]NEX79319.1 DNA repair exonuclease [Neobacillus thermocopriae]
MKKVTFIHAADLHLDSPMTGLRHLPATIFSRVKESTFTALKKLTKTAIDRKVDFVILAGDLFDGEDRSLRALSRFRAEMRRLEENGIPVYIVHGNHDHLNGSWIHLDMPPNVYVFPGEVEIKKQQTKTGERIHLYGFSYPTRHVFEKKIVEYQKEEGADFHIGILHGNEASGTVHDNYAPFTVQELQEKDFDYWALGHIHKRAVLAESPPIVYPGNIQGRNKKETGSKGFYHVTLTEIDTKLDFIEAADILWEQVKVDASTVSRFQELLQLCQKEINKYRKEDSAAILSLYIKNLQLADEHEMKNVETNLLELLLEEEKDEESFVWIAEIHITKSQQIDKEQLKKEVNFYGNLFETIERFENVDEAIASLYEHRLGQKHLSPLSEDEKRELIVRAEKLLLDLLCN